MSPERSRPVSGRRGGFATIFFLFAAVLLLASPSAAQQMETAVYRLKDRVTLVQDGQEIVRDVTTLHRHRRQDLGADLTQHDFTGLFVEARLTGLGVFAGALDPGDGVDIRVVADGRGRLDWLEPLPEPGVVRIVNDGIGGRPPTPLDRAASWTSELAIPGLADAVSADFAVRPFSHEGRDLALLTFSTRPSRFGLGEASGSITMRGIAVVSRDHRTVELAASEHSGEITVSGTTSLFRVGRNTVRLSEQLVPFLTPDAVPVSGGIADFFALPDMSDESFTGALHAEGPDPIPALLATVLAYDARLAAEAENRGNPAPLVAIALTINAVNMVDSILISTVRLAGDQFDNEKMSNWEGLMKPGLQAGGEAVGRMLGASNPEAWGKTAVKSWSAVSFASSVATFWMPGGGPLMTAMTGLEQGMSMLQKCLRTVGGTLDGKPLGGGSSGNANEAVDCVIEVADTFSKGMSKVALSKDTIGLVRDVSRGDLVRVGKEAVDLLLEVFEGDAAATPEGAGPSVGDGTAADAEAPEGTGASEDAGTQMRAAGDETPDAVPAGKGTPTGSGGDRPPVPELKWTPVPWKGGG